MSGFKTPAESHTPNTHDFSAQPSVQSFEPPSRDGDCVHFNLKPGEIASGRYRVQSLIGHGGMGMVYKVEQIFLGKELAMKVLSTRCASDITVRRFQHEARAAFGIDHPNLISVHDFGLLDEKIPFLVMDYIKGESLADRIKSRGTLTVSEAVPIFLRICFGLGYAHQQGVIHRDIKPSNIMLVDNMDAREEGSVKIVDFGIAKFTQVEKNDIQALTRTGEVFGSPLYMSPEQCSGSPVDERSDIYSLGCVFFEALTGTTPFVGANALSTMMMHMGEKTPSMKEASMGKEFPPLLEQIIVKMLAKSVSERYQNMAQVAGDLAALERNLEDPHLLANTVMVAGECKKDALEANLLSISKSALYLIMACIVILSSAASSLITLSLKNDINGTQKAAPAAKKSKVTQYLDDLEKRFLNSVDLNIERPAVTNQAIVDALELRRKYGICRLKLIFINDFAMDEISKATWIRNIDFVGSVVKNERLGELAKLPYFEHLSISHTNLNDEGAAGLARCPHLNDVSASWTNITAASIPYFVSLRKLERFEISGVRLSTESIRMLAEKRSLKRLVLRSSTGLTDQSFAPMVCSNLQFLNVENLPIGDDATIYLSQMRNLTSIALGMTKISARGIERLLVNEKLDTVLYVPTPELTEADVAALAKRYPRCHFVSKFQKGDQII
jgi:serine/threonine protein kinase